MNFFSRKILSFTFRNPKKFLRASREKKEYRIPNSSNMLFYRHRTPLPMWKYTVTVSLPRFWTCRYTVTVPPNPCLIPSPYPPSHVVIPSPYPVTPLLDMPLYRHRTPDIREKVPYPLVFALKKRVFAVKTRKFFFALRAKKVPKTSICT